MGFSGLSIHHFGAVYRTKLPVITGHAITRYIVGAAADGKVEVVLSVEFSKQLRAMAPEHKVTRLFGQNPFSVSLGDTLYLGLCYPLLGAAALAYPVLHIDEASEEIRLLIGDHQGRWLSSEAGSSSVVEIDLPELRSFFDAFGLLFYRSG